MSTDNGVSEFTVWYNTVLWLIVEPGTEDLDEGTTLGETGSWEKFENVWNSVGIVLNTGWLVTEEGPCSVSGISVKYLIDTSFKIGDTHNLSVVELVVNSGFVKVLRLSEWGINSWPSGSFRLVGLQGLGSWNGINESIVVIFVVSHGGHVHGLSGLETPLDGWSSGSKSVTLTNDGHGSSIHIWSGHWDISVDSHLTGEGESVVSEPLLSVHGNVQLGLLSIIIIKLPFWGLAMDGVDEVGVSTVGEWIGNELSLLDEDLLASGESALW